MKIGIKYSILLFALVIVMASCSQLQVMNVTLDNTSDQKQGIYYALPRSVIVVDVYVEKSHRVPGPFAAYGSKMLDLSDVIRTEKISYDIVNVELNTIIEPDPKCIYNIQVKRGLFGGKSKDIQFNLTESGILMGINAVNSSDTSFIIDNSIKSAGNYFDFRHLAFNDNLKSKLDTSYQVIQRGEFSYRRTLIEKTYQSKSVEDEALDAVKELTEINKRKFNLLSSSDLERPMDYQMLQFMVKELEELEKEYLNLFTGVVNKEITKYRFFVVPQERGVDTISFGQFTSINGIDTTNQDQVNRLNVMIKTTTNLQALPTVKPVKNNISSVYYRIPQTAIVTVKWGQKELASQNMMFPQLGKTYSLDMKMVKPNSVIEFYKNSGAIRRVVAQ